MNDKLGFRAVAALAVVASAVLLTACGASSSSSATAGGSTQYAKALAYAQCMRAHGVPNYPDPNSNGQIIPPSGAANAGSKQTGLAAQAACRHLQPNGEQGGSNGSAASTSYYLAYARCMRTHGEPNFPDPVNTGGQVGYTQTVLAAAGINLTSAAYQAANRACRASLGNHGGHS